MRTRHSAWNLVSGYAGAAAFLLVGFVTTPLLLRWLGPEPLGAYRAAADWAGYLALLELGLGSSARPLLAGPLGRGDRSSVVSALVACLRAYCWIAVLTSLATAGLAVAMPNLVPVGASLQSDLRCGLWLAALGC